MTFDAKHMEMTLIGWAITWPDRFYEIQELRAATHFTHGGCQKVFETMCRLYMQEGAGSIQTTSLIAKHLVREGMSETDAFAFLTECADYAPEGVEAGLPVRKEIAEAAMRRSLTSASTELASLATSSHGTTDEVANEASRIILDAVAAGADVQVADMRSEMQEEIERMEAAARGDYHQARGYPTGLAALDYIIGGLHNGEMIVIGARPSVGKTALLGSISANLILKQKLPGVIFSMEMRRGEYAARMISHTSEVNLQKARNRLLNPTELKTYSEHAKSWAETPWFLHDQGGVTLAKLGAVTRRLYHEFGIRWAAIDYIGLMDHQHRGAESDNAAITRTSKGIKALAQSLDIPIIALSQLNRDCERRDNKRPRLQDLRDSGSIEQDADVVAFLYRDSLYAKPEDNQNPPDVELAEIIVAKQRNGPIGTARVAFKNTCARFMNIPEGVTMGGEWTPDEETGW